MMRRLGTALVGLLLAASMAGCAAVTPPGTTTQAKPAETATGGSGYEASTNGGQTGAAGQTPAPGDGPAQTGQTQPTAPGTPPPPPADTRTDVEKARWVINTHWGPVVSDDPAVQGKKVALLTFDDGPSPAYTSRVLDTLKEHGVKAIFFVNGPAAEHPDLIKRMVAEGHLVGTHTLTHPLLTDLGAEGQRQEIGDIADIVEQITGKRPYYFRAPFGAYNDTTLAILKDLNMQLLNWDHGSGDWMDVRDGYKDPAIVIQDVLSEVPRNAQMTPLHPGSVILMHDTLRHTAEALPGIITGLKEKGYEFVIPAEGR
jgi:peptidoglycan/xylan/chitin deacetylase (PgdA/CDA1 family)